MECGRLFHAFFYQFEVRQLTENTGGEACSGALATVMVFAESDEVGRARAGRHIARQRWEITEFKRAMLIRPHHIGNLDGVLRRLYRQAEQAGICVCFDSWTDDGVPRTTWYSGMRQQEM